MKKADGKKTILHEKGTTQDIVNSVLSVFNDSYEDIKEFSEQFRATTERETALNIINYVLSNFKYKIDPDGEQWVKTPLRLLEDKQADCKSFSIFVCAVLTNLGIKNGFRFVSYTADKQVTHVYSWFIDYYGKKVIIDTVAMIQKGVAPFEEIKYKYKTDYMNTTKISKLSGVETETEITLITDKDTEAVVFVKSLLIKAVLFSDVRLINLLKSLIYVLQKYIDNAQKLEAALYSWSGLYISQDTSYNNQIKIIDTFVKNVAKNPNYTFDINILNDQNYINIQNWLAVHVYPYLYTVVDSDVEQELQLLNENTFNFLYLFVDNKYLSEIQRKKKENEALFLQTIIENTSINEEAALNFIYVFSCYKFGASPQNVLSNMFKTIPAEITSFSLSGIAKLAGVVQVEQPKPMQEMETEQQPTQDYDSDMNIGDWIDKAVDSFLKIFKGVKGNSNNSPVTPSYSDVSTGSKLLNYLLVGVLVFEGILLIKNKKNSKKRK